MRKRCIFWYPTIFHDDLKRIEVVDAINEIENDNIIKTIISKRDISDDSKEAAIYVSVTLDEKENLIIEFNLQNKDPFVVKIEKYGHIKNGFYQYRFDPDEIKFLPYEKFEKILKRDIYHIAKEFYHKHEVDPGKDSALRAIIVDEDQNGNIPKKDSIEVDDNTAMVSLLQNFATTFENYARHTSANNYNIERNEKLREELKKLIDKKSIPSQKKDYTKLKEKKEEIDKNILSQIKENNKVCENALIEYTYCKTLLCSRHNKSFRHDAIIKEENKEDEKNEWRRKALNIRNCIRYIENIKYKNQNRLHEASHIFIQKVDEVLKDSAYSDKKTTVLAWFSVFITCLSGIYSLWKVIKDKIAIEDIVCIGLIFISAAYLGFSLWKMKEREKK